MTTTIMGDYQKIDVKPISHDILILKWEKNVNFFENWDVWKFDASYTLKHAN